MDINLAARTTVTALVSENGQHLVTSQAFNSAVVLWGKRRCFTDTLKNIKYLATLQAHSCAAQWPRWN